jgi:multiple sugar transport system permease protein
MTFPTFSLTSEKLARTKRDGSTSRKRRSGLDGGSFFKYLVLIVVALVMLFPIYWIFVSSLKTLNGISASPPVFFPTDPQWQNYLAIFSKPNVILYLRNSAILVVANTLFTMISSSLVAYPLARMRFRGRSSIFILILATMMVPAVTVILPQFLLFREFGWLNSLLPLTIPALFAAPYNVFLFRQFFMTIPPSIDEAARLDGCNSFQLFFRIIVPLARPIFITVAVLSAISWWNELFLPIIYINSEELKPLALGATTAFIRVGGMGIHEWHEQMAFAMLMAIPPMIVYMIASRYISGGIKTTGIK